MRTLRYLIGGIHVLLLHFLQPGSRSITAAAICWVSTSTIVRPVALPAPLPAELETVTAPMVLHWRWSIILPRPGLPPEGKDEKQALLDVEFAGTLSLAWLSMLRLSSCYCGGGDVFCHFMQRKQENLVCTEPWWAPFRHSFCRIVYRGVEKPASIQTYPFVLS